MFIRNMTGVSRTDLGIIAIHQIAVGDTVVAHAKYITVVVLGVC